MFTIVVWETDESMPEEISASATTVKLAMQEADERFPNADALVITKSGDRKSLANRRSGEPWVGKATR